MFYTVYKTANLVNGKYYFGYHKTKDPQDGYLGSGKYLWRAIRKHGAANFKKEVLFTYLDAASAFSKEAELVEAFRNDPLCMNLRKGGAGGFDYINLNKLQPKERTGSKNPHFGKKQTDKNRTAVAASNRRRRKHLVREVRHIGVAESNRQRVWSKESRDRLGKSQRRKIVTAETRTKMAEVRAAWWKRKI